MAGPSARVERSIAEATRGRSVATDLFHVDGLTLVGTGRIGGEDQQPADARGRGVDLLDHAVGEVFLVFQSGAPMAHLAQQ
jgi:hypothetical protein